jgi:hypothetical protein
MKCNCRKKQYCVHFVQVRKLKDQKKRERFAQENHFRSGRVAQAIECLSGKHEALSLHPSTTKNFFKN